MSCKCVTSVNNIVFNLFFVLIFTKMFLLQVDSSLCDHSNKSQEVVNVINCIVASVDDDLYLKKALYKYGPLTVGYAHKNEKTDYLFGEQNFKCDENNDEPGGQNHALLFVGWTPKYFIFKNSWGIDWGIEVI